MLNGETFPIKIPQDILVTNPRHPFWSAGTGSKLKLTLKQPPDSQLKGMVVTVYTITEPYQYKLDIVMRGDIVSNTVYLKKKEAIRAVYDEWMQYYSERTIVEFIEHRQIDMATIVVPKSCLRISNELIESPRSPSPHSDWKDSCPPTPSPGYFRRNSFKNMLKDIAETHRKKSIGSSGDIDSPFISIPNSESVSESASNNVSTNISPRSGNSSPRFARTRRINSLPAETNFTDDELFRDPSAKISSNTNTNTNSPKRLFRRRMSLTETNSFMTSRETPKSEDESGRKSPRTTRLLRKASLKLALKLTRKNSSKMIGSNTPRNSKSDITTDSKIDNTKLDNTNPE